MTKSSHFSTNTNGVNIHQDSAKAKKQEAGRRYTAAHRSRRKYETHNLRVGINKYRDLLGEPLLDFKKPVQKDRRPTYKPPLEVASKMTRKELSAWRAKENAKRKKERRAQLERDKVKEFQFLRQEFDRVKRRYIQVFGEIPMDDNVVDVEPEEFNGKRDDGEPEEFDGMESLNEILNDDDGEPEEFDGMESLNEILNDDDGEPEEFDGIESLEEILNNDDELVEDEGRSERLVTKIATTDDWFKLVGTILDLD
jgi:hypothetical protein